jgi:hypothetical protein
MTQKIPKHYRARPPVEPVAGAGVVGTLNSRDAVARGELREAFYDALRAVAPEVLPALAASIHDGEKISNVATALARWQDTFDLDFPDLDWDVLLSWERSHELGQRFDLRALGGDETADAAGQTQPHLSLGPSAEIRVREPWRFFPKALPRAEARRLIMDNFATGLDRELDAIYDNAKGETRLPDHLRRDAVRLVLRHIHHLNTTEILDFEAGYPVRRADGTPLVNEEARQRRWTADHDANSSKQSRGVDKSIRNLATLLGLSVYRIPRGAPPSA